MVIFYQANGFSYWQLSDLLNVLKTTVVTVIKRLEIENKIDSISKKGRPRFLSLKRFILWKIMKNPKLSAWKVTSWWKDVKKKKISTQSVREQIKASDISLELCEKKKQSLVKWTEKKFKFCQRIYFKKRKFLKRCNFYRRNLILFGNGGKELVFRKPNTEFDQKTLE